MNKLVINGGKRLSGEVSVLGSKNVALKILVAACLTEDEVIVKNVPLISDFMVMVEIIRNLGGIVKFNDHNVSIRLENFASEKISLDKAAEIRTSYMFLAPLLARLGKAIIPNPGGCRIGARPIDRIVGGLKKMGVKIQYDSKDGYFHALAPKGLTGTVYKFSKSTHTGTETMLLSAVLARGITVLENAAQEPEIDELIGLLNRMGARIAREEPRKIIIKGVSRLHGTEFIIAPDRNEVVTFAIAALITEGDVFIRDIKAKGLEEFLEVVRNCGGGIEEKQNGIRFFYKGELKSSNVTTSFYPGFMTDWQGPWAVLMTKANGESSIHETVYENRFTYVEELKKMGANIEFYKPEVKNPETIYNFNIKDDNNKNLHAIRIFGPTPLHNAALTVADLRAGASLVLAALAARGQSVLFDIEHLDRGYEQFEQRLSSLGASIKRLEE
ncbi:MAG TPA: UDP-N-acetylglucosamine 1-carboxyvinyltransferase [Patescibacteria group bacterium]|jgi:UDP-N-acetylglucosamine 1-carboxyvinyltransferase|nr:UDP-N-acetylglucosamine 1-carboxyvinyltransferase [Patescibacteria group bacterium]